MEITEKEVAVLARGLSRLFIDVADKAGAYNLWLTPIWQGPDPVKDDK